MPSRNKLHNRKSRSKSSRRKQNKKTINKYHKKNNSHTHTRTRKNNYTRKNNRRQRGGFSNCSLATVQEPGFSIAAIGDVPGFSLSDTKGAIHRPNCKTDTYQAMTP